MYALLRPLLFTLPAEQAHDITLDSLNALQHLGLTGLVKQTITAQPCSVMGIDFPNPVGLAAGLDKNGDYIDALAALGFGFIEIGTITPKAQAGNPKPRMFRLPEAKAIINRMGFNNKGVDYLVNQVKQANYDGVLGINIGKNKLTPAGQAVDDYLYCIRKVYPYASYITVNLSSPNTPGLRDLQFGEPLRQLLQALKQAQQSLSDQHSKYVPLVVKIAPDMADDDLKDVANSFMEYAIDGVIATNTTIARDAVKLLPYGNEQGGLSGTPLLSAATERLSLLTNLLQGEIPVIGVGGICQDSDAVDKIKAGASLVQLYSGLVYAGPKLIADSNRAIAELGQ